MTKANFTAARFARSPDYPRECDRVIRSLLVRNALSAVLFIVAVVGIFLQAGRIREGLDISQARFYVAAYTVVALYALASIVVRVRAARRRR